MNTLSQQTIYGELAAPFQLSLPNNNETLRSGLRTGCFKWHGTHHHVVDEFICGEFVTNQDVSTSRQLETNVAPIQCNPHVW
jgi:hypothetical protein